MRLAFIGCLCLSIWFGILQVNESHVEHIIAKLDEWNKVFPQEKVYLHTDKPYYVFGDTIWYKVYLVNGQTLQPDTLSHIVYLELIDPNNKIVASRNQMIFVGGSAGEIGLPQGDWKPGKYQLRAYTRFMANQNMVDRFEKEFLIMNADYVEKVTLDKSDLGQIADRLDIQLLPESGHLVDGIKTVIGIKSIDKQTGLGVDVEGVIKNAQGIVIQTFKTFYRALGQFSFSPEVEEEYIAEVKLVDRTQVIQFPEIERSGYILGVKNKSTTLIISAMTNKEGGLNEGAIVCQMKGKVLAHSSVETTKKKFTISVGKETFPMGVMQITFFNGAMQPVAERLVYIEETGSVSKVILTTDKEVFNSREKVTLNIELEDGQPGAKNPANISIAVLDRAVIPKLEGEENIQSYLLLSSDLKGKIEYPGYYFETDDPKRQRLLDILMLTQGWRRYDWKDVIAKKPFRRKHPIEKGFTVEGHITKYNKENVPAPGYVTINTVGNQFYFDELKTRSDGSFRFENLPFFDTTQYLIQTRLSSKKSRKKKDPMQGKKWGSIFIDPFKPPLVHRDDKWFSPIQRPDDLIDFISITEKQIEIQNQYAMSIQLDEIVIRNKRIVKEEDPLRRESQLYKLPDNRIIMDSVTGADSYLSIFQLVRQFVPGVQIYGTYPDEIAIIRGFTTIQGSNEAMYMIDGIPTDAANITNLPIAQISHIDVIKGARAAIYGSQATNGVIIVYTQSGDGTRQRLSPGITNYEHPGPFIGKKFYAPNYEGNGIVRAEGLDLRTTLHWEPFVLTDSLGKASIGFYTCDKKSEYGVEVQGITLSGYPIVAHATFRVEGE